MADNQIKIDLLINASESAKTIGEQRKALKDLQSALGQLSEGSDAFNRVAAAAGGLRDQMADLRAQTQFYADDLRTLSGLTEIGEGIAASFGLVQSGLEALGVGSESATEAIRKLQIAQTALNSLQAIGNLVQKESAANILLTNTLKKLGITLTTAEGTAVEGLTIKQRILNLVQKASPMGILIGVVGALTAAYAFLGGKTKELTEEQKALNEEKSKTIADGEVEIRTFNAQIELLRKTKTNTEERKKALYDLHEQYGFNLKDYADEKSWLKQLNDAQEDYIKGIRRKIEAKINESKAESYIRLAQKQREEGGRVQDIKNQIQKIKTANYFNEEFRKADLYHWEQQLKDENEKNDRIAKGYEAKADKVLGINAKLYNEETAQEKEARKKSEKDAADAESKKIASANKTVNTEKTKFEKLEEINNKANQTIKDLYDKYATDLINAQLDLQQAQLENNEIYYNESFAEFEKYNTAYLDAFNKQQDDLLNNAIAKNDEAEQKELTAFQKKLDEQIGLLRKNNLSIAQAVKDGEDAKAKIVETYDIKGQKLIQDSNKVKEQKEIQIQAKLAEIKENARQQDLADLQANLDLAESNLISYNQKVSVLLRKNQFEYKFPEASSPIQVKNVEQNVKALNEIERLLKDETSEYGKELEAIYQRQRLAIDAAVLANKTIIKETKELTLYDENRGKLNIELNEINKKQAEELYALVLKIQKEKQLGLGATQAEIDLAKEYGDTTLTDTIKALEFTNKRVIIEGKVNGLLKGQVGDREKLLIGLRDSKQISQEEYQLSIESVETIKEFYRLLVQQNVVSSLYNENLNEKMKAEKLGVEYAEDKKELLFGQTVEIKTQNEELSKFLNEQSKSSEEINKILAERADLLETINQIQDPYEKEAQTIQTYLSTSSRIADILQEDAKRFEDYGRNWVEKLFNVDSYETEFEKALLQLSSRLTSQLDIEKATFESNRKKLQDDLEAVKGGKVVTDEKGQILTQIGINAQLEKLEKDHQNKLKKITEDGALAQIQIEEQRVEKERQGKQKIFQETLSLISQSLDAYAEFANRQAEIEIARIEREKKAALDQFDLDMKYQEMKRNDAEIGDYQEAIRQKEITDKRQAIEDEYNAKANEQKRKAFNAQKIATITQIVFNTALGVMQSFATFGPIVGGILSGIIIAAAAVQTSLVASQPAPEFAKGGILNGPSHANGGIQTAYGELEGGEAIINKKSTKMFAPLLSAINEAGGGVQFASGGTIPTTPVTMNTSNDFTEIKGMLREFASKPILTYVNESEVTRAQRNQRKIEKRTSF